MPQIEPLEPRDKYGKLIRRGDIVLVPFRVTDCTTNKSYEDQPARPLLLLHADGPAGKSGMTPRLDAFDPKLVTLVEPKLAGA